MFSMPERLIAWRYLRARRQEGFISIITWFSLIGIALGVATLIVVMAVMNGFRSELIGRILGLNGHVNVYAVGRPFDDYADAAGKLRALTIVKSVTPTVEGQALLTRGDSATGVVLRGMGNADLQKNDIFVKPESIVEGNLADVQGSGVLIGKRMADRFNLHVGDPLTLISPEGASGPLGPRIRKKTFTVAAVFDVGMYEYDSSFVFCALDQAQIFFQLGSAVSALEVRLFNPREPGPAVAAISTTLGFDFRATTWESMNASFVNALGVERNVMFLILTLIILVAAFNIISSLIMLVKDKTRGIAILRTMGATRGAILRIFFLCGASIGVVGTLAGLALGVSFALNIARIQHVLESILHTQLFNAEIYFLAHLPAEIEWHEVAQVAGLALFLSFAATVYPAWRAARLDPVEALRGE